MGLNEIEWESIKRPQKKKHGLVGDKHTSFGPWKGGVSYWGEEIIYLPK